MRFCYFLLLFFINYSLFAKNLNPCQMIDFDIVLDDTVPRETNINFAGISIEGRNEEVALLKKCLKGYSVCIVETKMGSKNWFRKQLIVPDDEGFDPDERTLIFGLVQYFDEKTNSSVCILGANSFAHAIPWVVESWVIHEGGIRRYEIWDTRYNLGMTPSELYQAFLDSHKEAVERGAVATAKNIAANQIAQLQKTWF